jgi:hypothetical protein
MNLFLSDNLYRDSQDRDTPTNNVSQASHVSQSNANSWDALQHKNEYVSQASHRHFQYLWPKR